MEKADKIEMVKAMSEEADDEVISAYLTIAGRKIISRAYPFSDSVTEVPTKYEHIQIEATVYLLNKRGAEGESAHSENGISRSYENGDLPESMLSEIVPVGKVSG